MDIQSQYARLQDLAKTEEGWQKIESAWLTATNHEKRDGEWYSNGASRGDLVVGFAMDSKTMKTILGSDSFDHSKPMDQLVKLILRDEGISVDEVLERVMKGWAGIILDFNFPCIFMAHRRLMKFGDEEPNALLIKLEQSILDQGLGLPITGLFHARI